jgi:hypothetical protein
MILATEHPSPGELARYAVADQERCETVRRHLESGCGVCLLAVRRLQEIVAAAEGDDAVVPRGWVVPQRIALHPAAGQRGTSRSDVQILCTAGPYDLDILVRDPGGAGRALDLVGQVTRAGDAYEPVADLPVVLVEAGTGCAAGQTTTDAFGEFDLRFGPGGTHGLRLGTTPDAPCLLLWPQVEG